MNYVCKKYSAVVLVMVLVLAGVLSADVQLPSVISDNMVLQQGKAVPIWGWADANEVITVTGNWGSGKWETTADRDGKWMVKIDTGKAGGPYEMTVSGKNPITVKNILVGEVWVCSGQSNMEFTVKQAKNSAEEIAEANNYPQIRQFLVGRKVIYTPMYNCNGKWVVCSSTTAGTFTAVGYFFGREVTKQLDNVPVGLINTSWGGTPVESWMSKEYLENDPNFQPILKRFEETSANITELKAKYREDMQKYDTIVPKLKAEGKPLPPRPEEPIGPGHAYSPMGLYNGMIVPILPYGIRGAIWYQGESNAWRAYQYRTLFPAMIKNWRDAWHQGDFPFLFVQLANYMEPEPQPVESDWAELREAQLMTLSSVPNTGMAVTIDIGEPDIHPKNKQDVGKRLALWALAKTYGKNIVYSGPIYKSMKVDGNNVVLAFDDVGGGLVAKGDSLKGFAIAGADRKFVWADAKIKGDTIVVSSDKVASPVSVRYAWEKNPVCNLYNKEGLPATPFRTDTWPGITAGKR
ncbi:MAG: sialate O-acetylesterase [Sedimentisphaerales bacterium]|jgi:sialate O-acetylesterase